MPGNRTETLSLRYGFAGEDYSRGPGRRQRAAATSARFVQVAVAARACLTLSSTA